jgi:serine protease Do
MSDQPDATRTRRAFAAAGTAVAGILAIATAAWLATSPGPKWRDPSAWYDPAAGFHSAAPPVGFENLVDRIKPAVVGVQAKVELDEEEESARAGRGISPGERASPQPHTTTSQGSGFFISSDGLAMTTYHVVARNKKIEVVTDNGRTYAAKMVGADPKTDLALLKVEGGNFPVVQMADKAPRIGEWVLAIGNPFGLGGTVTAGIVSAAGRAIFSPYSDFIQIDAPINKGNSGGPTFDATGRVIGVNSAIFSPSGGSVGIGFAIPAETVKTIAAQLKAKGAVSRGWMGIEVQSMSPDIAEGFGLDKRMEGVVVTELQPDSPARKAGIEPGDVITSLADRSTSDERDLMRRVAEMPPGQIVELHLMRRSQEKSITVALDEQPVEPTEGQPDAENPQPARGGDKSRLGVMLMAADTLGLGGKGVVVAGLAPSGVAAESGLSVGDVILDVSGNAMKTSEDFFKALDGVQTQGRRIALARIKSNEATRFVAIPVD